MFSLFALVDIVVFFFHIFFIFGWVGYSSFEVSGFLGVNTM